MKQSLNCDVFAACVTSPRNFLLVSDEVDCYREDKSLLALQAQKASKEPSPSVIADQGGTAAADSNADSELGNLWGFPVAEEIIPLDTLPAIAQAADPAPAAVTIAVPSPSPTRCGKASPGLRRSHMDLQTSFEKIDEVDGNGHTHADADNQGEPQEGHQELKAKGRSNSSVSGCSLLLPESFFGRNGSRGSSSLSVSPCSSRPATPSRSEVFPVVQSAATLYGRFNSHGSNGTMLV